MLIQKFSKDLTTYVNIAIISYQEVSLKLNITFGHIIKLRLYHHHTSQGNYRTGIIVIQEPAH